ncbi:MAG TPA: tRNA lysidine(34) synthetase TilS [Terracidiphilus sp.]|nr:tRNA lysidine(34) synthetase TilS [Terracidiphilus sp.]
MRLAVGVSGGADSVALLRALAARAEELGLVLSVAHLHHGLRGADADADLEFVRELAAKLGLPLLEARVDTAAEAQARRETIEEAARRLRYQWFRKLMGGAAGPENRPSGSQGQIVNAGVIGTTEVVPLQSSGAPGASGDLPSRVPRREGPEAPAVLLHKLDAVATAHTLDDQAETVLAKFLRGAWTEGLSGIHPVVEFPEGRVVRPLLETTRAEVEAYLKALGQDWREDSTNRHLTFNRNRIRHELLPLLEGWNPRLKEHLAQMAELARDEDAWWEDEVRRLAPGVVLTGKPVRGGGRAASEGLALDLARLAELTPAMQRRMARHAAAGLGFAPDFVGTEALRKLALQGHAGQKCELAGGLRAERTHRELRLTVAPEGGTNGPEPSICAEVTIPVPGEGESAELGIRIRIELSPSEAEARRQPSGLSGTTEVVPPQNVVALEIREDSTAAVLRNWRAGDRVRLRHSAGPKKVKEVLERLKVTGAARARWPVLELKGRIVWMRGVAVEPEAGVTILATELKGPAASYPAG